MFAKEVATLSLILADYPNRNGWDIRLQDLFSEDTLTAATPRSAIVLCNPPFDNFAGSERSGTRSFYKPIAVLESVLTANPLALGFVMPHGLIVDRTYAKVRRQLAQAFDEIELISLPDGIFERSKVESSLLIARRKPDGPPRQQVALRSGAVKDAEREEFLSSGKPPQFRLREVKRAAAAMGDLWISELESLWDYLADYPRLGSVVEIHRGMEWKSGHQARAWSSSPKADFRAGYHAVDESLRQFLPPKKVFLDCRKAFQLYRALELPWDQPKVLINAARLSRAPWRLAAWVDTTGALASQQFIGCWPKSKDVFNLGVIAAWLNSPLANAYVTSRDERKRFRLSTLQSLPIPSAADFDEITARVTAYLALVKQYRRVALTQGTEHLERALLAIDAAVLRAYDLPPRLERQLLDYFQGHSRRALGGRSQYFDPSFRPYISLQDYVYRDADAGRSIEQVFTPLSNEDSALLGEWL